MLAGCLAIDHWTADVVSSLRAAAIEPLLLKGPAISRWLYADEPGARGYTDADLMVAAHQFQEAREVLGRLDFACVLPLSIKLPGDRPRHAEAWWRESDGATVDLHRSLHSTEHLDPERVWAAVSRASERIDLFGVPVEIPAESTRTLHVVLHLRPKDTPNTQAWVDLERAIARVPLETWGEARDLAFELGVDREMGALLRLVDAGPLLADHLGLPDVAPDYLVYQHERDAWPEAEQFVADLALLGRPAALRQIGSKLFPPPDYVRAGRPFARRGNVALGAVYVWRLVLMPVRLLDWCRYRRRSAPLRRPGLRGRPSD